MESLLFFVPKFQVFKSLTKISVYDILTNNFKVNLSQKIKPEYCVPIKQYFEEISIFYEIGNENRKSYVQRFNKLGHHFILIILVLSIIRCLIYIFWEEEDQLKRLYGGNLEQFFGLNIRYFSIPQAGVTLYVFAIFCLLQYSQVKQLNWLTAFNSIEGRQSFAKSKIFMRNSAKKLIRISLILIIYFSSITNHSAFLVCFFYTLFPFMKLNLSEFFFYALPWSMIDAIWTLLACQYFFAGLIIFIICYYYESRLDQLNIYVSGYLKRKQFNRINQQMSKVLAEYSEIINEINQFNKFCSKLIFFLLLFCSSTLVFLIYNMVYVKIDWLMYSFYTLFCGNVSTVIIVMLLSTIKIGNKFQRNKRNLIKLCYIKNFQNKNRFKVCLN